MKNSGWHFVNGQFWKGGCASRRCRNGRLDGSWVWKPAIRDVMRLTLPSIKLPVLSLITDLILSFKPLGWHWRLLVGPSSTQLGRPNVRAQTLSIGRSGKTSMYKTSIGFSTYARSIRVYVPPIINMTICRGFRSQQIVRRGPLTKPLQASLSNRSCRALSEDACTFVVVICITSIQHRRDWFPVKRPRRCRNRIHVSIVSQNMGFKYLFMLPSDSTRVYFVTNDCVGIKAGPGERQRSNVPGGSYHSTRRLV